MPKHKRRLRTKRDNIESAMVRSSVMAEIEQLLVARNEFEIITDADRIHFLKNDLVYTVFVVERK